MKLSRRVDNNDSGKTWLKCFEAELECNPDLIPDVQFSYLDIPITLICAKGNVAEPAQGSVVYVNGTLGDNVDTGTIRLTALALNM